MSNSVVNPLHEEEKDDQDNPFDNPFTDPAFSNLGIYGNQGASGQNIMCTPGWLRVTEANRRDFENRDEYFFPKRNENNVILTRKSDGLYGCMMLSNTKPINFDDDNGPYFVENSYAVVKGTRNLARATGEKLGAVQTGVQIKARDLGASVSELSRSGEQYLNERLDNIDNKGVEIANEVKTNFRANADDVSKRTKDFGTALSDFGTDTVNTLASVPGKVSDAGSLILDKTNPLNRKPLTVEQQQQRNRFLQIEQDAQKARMAAAVAQSVANTPPMSQEQAAENIKKGEKIITVQKILYAPRDDGNLLNKIAANVPIPGTNIKKDDGVSKGKPVIKVVGKDPAKYMGVLIKYTDNIYGTRTWEFQKDGLIRNENSRIGYNFGRDEKYYAIPNIPIDESTKGGRTRRFRRRARHNTHRHVAHKTRRVSGKPKRVTRRR